MSYQEPPHFLELIASLCALPLVVACRIEGGAVGAPETLAWLGLCWAILSTAGTICGAKGRRQLSAPQVA